MAKAKNWVIPKDRKKKISPPFEEFQNDKELT